MLAWVVFVICVGLLLMVGIERLLARLGIERQDPDSAPRGLAAIAERLERWAEERDRDS